MKFKLETEFAQKVLLYLQARNWDCYPEVQFGGARADIVAVRGPLVRIVEVKLSLSLSLLDQGHHWVRQGCANFVSIASPGPSGNSVSGKILKYYGIGHLYGHYEIMEDPRPRLFRNPQKEKLLKALHQGQKAYLPGNANGDFYSPFKRTCEEVRRVAQKKPGILFKDLIKEINHHYYGDSAAKSALYGWIREGFIKGICFQKLNGKLIICEKEL